MTDAPLVETAAGTVRGRALPEGGRLFAGIPFAEPPVGELRLRPPRPPAPWRGVREADRFAPAPAQGGSPLMSEASQRAPFPAFPTAAITETSEDCLHLNVWNPRATGDGPRPVIVWFYGGGFETGSAAPPYSDGAALARQTGTVVVTAYYRLGALGFLHLVDLLGERWAGSTNLALQDQAGALRWVRENIAGFRRRSRQRHRRGPVGRRVLHRGPARGTDRGRAVPQGDPAERQHDPDLRPGHGHLHGRGPARRPAPGRG